MVKASGKSFFRETMGERKIVLASHFRGGFGAFLIIESVREVIGWREFAAITGITRRSRFFILCGSREIRFLLDFATRRPRLVEQRRHQILQLRFR
jgi:hypothetical protein